MDSLLESVQDIRKRTPFCDLEIRCGDAVFFVHRFVVFSKSKVLAAECGEDYKEACATTIEHTLFDALTFERMLLFMYQGDYSVRPSTNGAETTHEKHRGHQKLEDSSKKALPVVKGNEQSNSHPGLTSIAHVNVYAIAVHYDMPDLRAISLKKFKDGSLPQDVDELLEVAKAAYRNTGNSEDELRKELLFVLMNERTEWLSDARFESALANDTDLHLFSVDMTFAMFEKLKCRAVIADDLATAKERIIELEGQMSSALKELREALASKLRLEDEFKSMKTWAGKTYEEAATNFKAVRERDALVGRLTQSAKENTNLLHREIEKVDVMQREVKELEKKVKELETKLKQETKRANTEANNAKKKSHKEQETRANKAVEQLNKAQKLINSLDCCKECGSDFSARLDNRGNKKNKSLVVRCADCNRQHGAK